MVEEQLEAKRLKDFLMQIRVRRGNGAKAANANTERYIHSAQRARPVIFGSFSQLFAYSFEWIQYQSECSRLNVASNDDGLRSKEARRGNE